MQLCEPSQSRQGMMPEPFDPASAVSPFTVETGLYLPEKTSCCTLIPSSVSIPVLQGEPGHWSPRRKKKRIGKIFRLELSTVLFNLFLFISGNFTRFYRLEESLIIPFGLIGIEPCKGPDRPVKHISLPDIPRNHRNVT